MHRNVSNVAYRFLRSKNKFTQINLCLDNLPEVFDASSLDKDTTSTSEVSSNDIRNSEESIAIFSTINSQGKRVIAKAAWEKFQPIPLNKLPYDIKHYVVRIKKDADFWKNAEMIENGK